MLRLEELLLGEFLRLGVGMVPLVVVEVPVELALGLGGVALVRPIVLVGRELVAFVEAASVRAVLLPGLIRGEKRSIRRISSRCSALRL